MDKDTGISKLEKVDESAKVAEDKRIIKHTIAILEYCEEHSLTLADVKNIILKVNRKANKEMMKMEEHRLVIDTETIHEELRDPWRSNA